MNHVVFVLTVSKFNQLIKGNLGLKQLIDGTALLASELDVDDEYFDNEKSLAIPSSIGQQTLKRKVDEAFVESWGRASKRLTTVVKVQQGKFDSVEKLLDLYGEGCGACILENRGHLPGHRIQDCPTLSEHQIGECKKLRQKLDYRVWPEKNGACWKCHILAGGQNQWHGDYGVSSCPRAHLVWPMAYVVWSKVAWREKMRKDLGIRESLTLDTDFTKWFSGKHEEYFTNGIALLSWVAKYVLVV